MTPQRTALIVAVLAAALASPRAQQTHAAANTAAVIGQVLDSATRQGVAQAIVRLSSGMLTQIRIADDRGRFYFVGLPAGAFTITAMKGRFIDGAYGKRRAGGGGLPLVVAAGELVSNIEIALFRSATISGVVLDEANEPAARARVIAFKRQFVGSGWRYVPAGTAIANDLGEYRIFGLVPGEYVVSVPGSVISIPTSTLEQIGQTGGGNQAVVILMLYNAYAASGQELARMVAPDAEERNAVLAAPAPTPPPSSGPREFTYPTQFFPGADVAARATPVAVDPGDDYSGVNFQLQPVPAARVTGVTIGPDGPAPNQVLRLLVADGDDQGFGTETAATVSGLDGSFEFLRIPPGRYRIEARSAVSMIVVPNSGRPQTIAGVSLLGVANPEMRVPTRDFDDLPLGIATVKLGQDPLWGREEIVVHDDHVDDVIVRLSPPVAVTGRVTLAGTGTRPSAADVAAVEIALEAVDNTAMPLAPVQADAAGVFTFDGVVPGEYLLREKRLPDGWFLQSAAANGRDVTDRTVHVSNSGGTALSIVLTTRGTSIAGTVRDARSIPASNATVLVFAASGTAHPSRLREVRVSRYGVFNVTGLPPGEYFVAAIDEAAAEGWQDAGSLQQLRRAATRVTLRQGGAVSLDLRIR